MLTTASDNEAESTQNVPVMTVHAAKSLDTADPFSRSHMSKHSKIGTPRQIFMLQTGRVTRTISPTELSIVMLFLLTFELALAALLDSP